MEMRVSARSAAGLAGAAGLAPRTGLSQRFWSSVLCPVDAAWLVALRVAYGLILSVSLLRFIAYGWIDRFFVEPSFHFKYWGFGWVGVLPPGPLHALFWALAGLGLLVACGVWFRLSASLLWLGFTYVQLIDVANYLNHYYLASLLGLLLALSPAAPSRAAPPPAQGQERTVPAGWLYLMRFQVGVVYVYAGLAKLHADWLLEGQPLGIWLSSRLDFPVLGVLFRSAAAPLLLSWAGFLFDTTIVFWLSWRRSRPYAYALLLVFHALTSVLFPIGMFPVIMSAAALVFFAPDWPRRLLARGAALLGTLRPSVSGAGAARWQSRWRGALAVSAAAAPWADQEPPRTPSVPSARARWFAALALGYCALQAVLPLRFALYGDNVRWHEQGMRFSWRVMVREKNGSVTFRVTSPASGRVFEVSPRRYLTPLQEREMAGQPDLILQLARHIRADFERQGLGPVEVRVDAWVSLNGRRARRLIDPDVDLTRVGSGLAPAAWILPAPDERAPVLSRGHG